MIVSPITRQRIVGAVVAVVGALLLYVFGGVPS